MKQSLLVKFIGVGFALLFVFLHRAQAANFLIPCGDTAALVSAINTANDNGVADTINLTADCDYAFTSTNGTDSALPHINSQITINGTRATIRRAGGDVFRVLHVTDTGNLTLNQVTIRGGSGVNGGGILNEGVLTIRGATIRSNSASSIGGGIAHSGTTLTVNNSIIIDNSAQHGGGIYTISGTLTMANSIISGNRAQDGGGGIFNDQATVVVTGTTISGNGTTTGLGGIDNSLGTVTVTNSLIWGNERQISNTATVTYSIVEGGFDGASNLDADPLFVSPVSYTSAPTIAGDYHIQFGSPAIDSGNNGAASGPDIDNATRVLYGTVDRGADEVDYCLPYKSPYTVPAGDEAKLVMAIWCANTSTNANVINLTNSVYSFLASDMTNSDSALPRISTPITINGNGAALQRADGSPAFRLLYVTSGGSLTLNNVVVNGGSSTFGGGVNNNATLTVQNSILSGNSASSHGGGIYNNTGATTTVTNSTIAGNTSLDGGGIHNNSGTLIVTNGIVWGNSSQITATGGTTTVTFTIVQGGFAGTSNLNMDPQFVSPAVYTSAPTSTGDYHIQSTSPVIDAGNNAKATGTDIDGDPRIVGVVDIGADEANYCLLYSSPYAVAAGDTTDLARAIRCANADADASIINLAANSSYTFTVGDILNSDSALPRITTPVTINGTGATLQRESGAAVFRLLYVSSSGNLTLNNIIVLGGSSSFGGSIRNEGGKLALSDSSIASNNANSGGGIYNNGMLTVTNSTLDGNRAGYGAGIYNTNNGTLTVINSTLSDNHADNSGGGIYSTAGVLTVSFSTFSSNRADENTGGGIHNLMGPATVTNSIFTGNSATGGGGPSGGGGIYNSGGMLTVSNSTLSGNSGRWGGGISSGSGFGTGTRTTTIVINSILSGNSATVGGGGLFNDDILTVTNSIISGNHSTGMQGGGGIYNAEGMLTVTNSTLSGNFANSGGGVRNGGFGTATLMMANSIVWGNSSEIVNAGGTSTVSYSLIQGGFGGTGNLAANPLFISAVSHTLAPTSAGDYRLQADSPALNIGSNAALPQDIFDLDGDNDVIEPVPFDLDGNPRIVNSTVDIGAYEHQTLAGITVSESTASVAEGGTTDTYTIRLNSRPSANVTIDLSTGGQATASPDLLTFTLSNWSIAQTVTVSAVNDDIMDGTQSDTISHSVESSDIAYDGMTVGSVSVSVTDNDTAGVTVEPTAAVIEGGATDTYAVVLNSEPTADVTITPTGDADCSVSGALTFTNVDWDTPQNITVTAVDDDIAEGPHGCTITNTAVSADPNYNGIAVASVAGTVADNEAAGVTIEQTVDVTEGGTTDTYTVILTSRPSADVTITSAGDTQCTVSAALTFTDVDWDIPQAVTVTAVDDDIAEGSHACVIINAAASSDPDYNRVTVAIIDVTITDNDTAGVNISESTVSVTEGGATATYNVVLTSKPTSDVTITSTGDEQCTTSAVLTFTNLDWDIPQPVTVTAVDDQALEGTHTCHVAHSSASLDPNYDGITIPSVTVSVTDNELNLLANGDFELYDGNKRPDSWTVKYPAGDKIKCNTLDKTISFTGICAFKFKGGPDERAKLIQNVNLSGVTFSQNDTLSLSAYFKGGTAVKATLILNVRYVGNPVPVKVKTAVGSNTAYTGLTVSDLSISAGTIQQIKVIIRHNSPAGKLFVDAATLSLANGLLARSDVLPPPEAPDGFRGGN